MMIINIILVLVIATTVFILLTRSKQTSPTEVAAPSPSNTPAVIFNTSNTVPEQAGDEINTLKQQLENENSRLKTLRVQEELVESIRKESELRETMHLQDQTEAQAPALDAPEADNKDIPKKAAQ